MDGVLGDVSVGCFVLEVVAGAVGGCVEGRGVVCVVGVLGLEGSVGVACAAACAAARAFALVTAKESAFALAMRMPLIFGRVIWCCLALVSSGVNLCWL